MRTASAPSWHGFPTRAPIHPSRGRPALALAQRACRAAASSKSAAFFSLILSTTLPTHASDPILIHSPELQTLNPNEGDGTLPLLPGTTNIQIHRATSPNHTYHHHVDLACWRSRLYISWNSTEKDEDTGPSRQLFSTSPDALHWTPPQDLFPPEIAIPLRMYFYLASNGHMLAIAGLRASSAPLVERDKHALLVREILPTHTLGPVHTLQLGTRNSELGTPPPPSYTSSPNKDFISACQSLLSNTTFLLQEDYGVLLPKERRMPWNDPANWPESLRNDAQLFGKAPAFFHRKDGRLVSISKRGWTSLSPDDGKSWPDQPTIPPTLITGMAKVWPQKISDDQYALVYNPHPVNRWPLTIVTGPDGIHFSHLRVIHPVLPAMRYPGLNKVLGPQYVRGISEFSTDHSFPDKSLFVAYSVNKEDIWITRIPTPITPDPDPNSPHWNLYSPQWAPATLTDGILRLEDSDPTDAAIATRIFPPTTSLQASFEYRTLPSPRDAGVSPAPPSEISNLKLSLFPPTGPTALRFSLPAAQDWTPATLTANSTTHTSTLTLHNKPTTKPLPLPTLGRLTFHTDNNTPITPTTDKPLPNNLIYEIRNVVISAKGPTP